MDYEIIRCIFAGDLAKAIRSKTPHIHFGLYHSMFEWFNPLYLADKRNNFTTNDFVVTKTMPELYELVGTDLKFSIIRLFTFHSKDPYSNLKVYSIFLLKLRTSST